MIHSCSKRRQAFSLVELSVVLVILGLLAGGVLSGQSLIRAAELRDVSNQITKHSIAINSFRDKYFSLPGDMPNATAFWNMAPGATTDAECAALTTASPDKRTCNGNGDGRIGVFNSTAAAENYEMFRAWQHLANAGLIEGSYSGVTGSLNNRDSNVGVNVPGTKISSVGISYGYIPSSVGLLADVTGNIFSIGIEDNADNTKGPTWSPFLKPEESYSIDVKIDDGRPGYGKLRGGETTAGACHTTTTSSTSQYSLMGTSPGCALYYIF